MSNDRIEDFLEHIIEHSDDCSDLQILQESIIAAMNEDSPEEAIDYFKFLAILDIYASMKHKNWKSQLDIIIKHEGNVNNLLRTQPAKRTIN